MKKSEQRKISFVLFVVAVFFAGVVLAEFHSSLWMVLAAGVVLTAAACFFIWGQETKEQSTSGKTSEILFADRMAEWARSNEKAEKNVGIAVKKQQEAMTEGMSALKEKLSEVVRTQENTIKTLILYNKENAKQIALSEREELARLCRELQKTIQAGFDAMNSKLADTSGSAEDMQRTGKELLNSLEENFQKLTEAVETAERIPAAPVYAAEPMPGSVMEEKPVAGEVRMPEASAEGEAVTVGSVEEEPEAMEELLPEITEEEPVPVVMEAEPAPETTVEAEAKPAATAAPVIPEVDLSDPNKAMSADDIAALFATLGASEPAAAEPAPETTVEAEAEPAAAAAPVIPEVDLSDPNKAMSADDIAALFATLGASEPAAAEPAPETTVEAEPEPAATAAPVIPEVDLSDPNKAMSPDDIAALFAALGGAEEEPAPEISAEAEPEPAAAAAPAIPEVDLSDPNKAMSPDDIAALFAAMGN